MAVSYVASPAIVQTTSHSSSQSITVPSGATIALICFAGYDWATGGSGSSCSLGGQSGTYIAMGGAGAGADELSMVYWVRGFSTGSQTLSWTLNGERSDGLQIAVVFFSGEDTTTPIRSSGTSLATSISLALSSQSGDMGLLFISDWTNDCSSAGAGQTVVVDSGQYNMNEMDAAYEASTGTTTTLTGTQGGDGSAVGVIIAAAAGGPSTVVQDVIMRGVVVRAR